MKCLRDLPLRRRAVLAAAVVICLVVVASLWQWRRSRQAENPLITTPRLALAELEAKSLYFNGAARPWLLAQRPDLLTAEDRDERSDRSRAFAQAVVNPGLFRQLDRRYRFDTLLFVGDPSQYRTLLDKLVETNDFTLSYVDHTSLVFRRPGASWAPASLAMMRAQIAMASPRERATALALAGTKLISLRRQDEGRALLEEAKALDPRVAEVWSGLALAAMNRGNWPEALGNAQHALSIDEKHLSALSVRTQSLFALKRFNEAYDLSKRLVELLPDDPNILFKHAQIAHEAHAFQAEITALEKLIARAIAEQRETGGYRLYLAQAYAAVSDGPKAVENFEHVARDPSLPADQRDFARDSIARIKSRTGM